MTDDLPAETYPFQHKALEDAGLVDPLELAYTHTDVTTELASLGTAEYIYDVRKRLGVTCPNCGEAAVEPTDRSYQGATLAPHVTCAQCTWQGTAGDVERQQFLTFTDHDTDTVYALWKAFGDVTSFAGAPKGRLKRECRAIDGIAHPVHEREAVAEALPAALTPTPPPLVERFTIDGAAVDKAVGVVSETTPYDEPTVRTFVRQSYAVQSLQPTDEETVLAQTGSGRIAGAVARQPMTATDEQRITKGYSEMKTAIQRYVDRTGFATQREAVMAVRIGFEPILQRRLRSDIVADVVGCNDSYAAEFELVTVRPFPVVLKKEHVARREMKALTESMRRTVKERDSYACLRCETTDELEVHHIIPVAQGGATNLANLATLCEDCHAAAHGGSYGPTVVYASQDSFWEWVSDKTEE